MKKTLFGALSLTVSAAVFAGQTTPVPDVAPVAKGQQVVINIPQQRLFLYEDGILQKVYPVAVGKAMTQTNLGQHKIGAKAFNPTWHIPLSIQKELNNGVKTIQPGPKNPLGPVFVRLGDPKLGLGIHGTNAPTSVPGVRSHGCVRMKSPDALEFAKRITTGSPATVSYEMATLNEDGAGNLWLAAFKDPYNKKNLKVDTLKKSIAAWGKDNNRTISTARIDQIIKARAGTPVCLTCKKGSNKIVGDFTSIAWNSGSSKFTTPVGGASVRPSKNDVLPEGSEVETNPLDDNTSAAELMKNANSKKTENKSKETPLTPLEASNPAKAKAAEKAASLPKQETAPVAKTNPTSNESQGKTLKPTSVDEGFKGGGVFDEYENIKPLLNAEPKIELKTDN
ncbi:L,D-transpeptidase [Kingella negevensis]|nr:L,D-transpeptidase [Kingella negevensis]MDK4679283.1 L,D-transpeptidase [Kingella negevensis]MDK4682995.1 L,D-transpeptidase [Kingella negevensis]MDK4691195.1 L,D-transpeptidase [Kingella negevensis]MDK4693657.1 L,D-transpeptidase [Kingella negevensis]MDK4700473.1 L,D-transpeptidase [Kingella negevensis]